MASKSCFGAQPLLRPTYFLAIHRQITSPLLPMNHQAGFTAGHTNNTRVCRVTPTVIVASCFTLIADYTHQAIHPPSTP